MTTAPLIPPHGGYRRLKSFQLAQLAYDLTIAFVERYIARLSADFIDDGGFTERLYRARIAARDSKKSKQ